MKRWVNGTQIEPRLTHPSSDWKFARPWRNKKGEVRWQPKDGPLYLWRGEDGTRWLESGRVFGVIGPKLYKSQAKAERKAIRRVTDRAERINRTFVPDE